MSEKRVRIIISGHVQGVGYRVSCEREANRLGVKGWIRNRWDGTVEAQFEGAAAAVDAMVAWCRQGPPAAHVLAVEIREPRGSPSSGFHVRSAGDD